MLQGLQIPNVQGGASVRAFTPGFDLNAPDLLKRTGGLELTAVLSISSFLDQAQFRFRMTPPTGSAIVPDFVAKASVTNLTIPGFAFAGPAGTSPLLRISGAQGQLSKISNQLTVGSPVRRRSLGWS